MLHSFTVIQASRIFNHETIKGRVDGRNGRVRILSGPEPFPPEVAYVRDLL
jgi:hypothetical protein